MAVAASSIGAFLQQSVNLKAVPAFPCNGLSSRSEGLKWRLCLEAEGFTLANARAVALPGSRPPVSSCRGHFARSKVCCMASGAVTDIPTVADTKAAFLKVYKKPIPSLYNTILQELLVQQHLMRYNATYQYDAVFALGFVTVYDQFMDGYPNTEDRNTIFKAYISALNEDPDQYRKDAKKLEEWAVGQNASSIVSFPSQEGEVEQILKDIAARAGGKGTFHYSRFFAIGLFRLAERANALDPAVLEQLCKALNVSKLSVDRDLDVYRNLLSKLAQAKDLLKEYLEREKKKQAEREAPKPNEAAATVEAT